MSPAMSKRRWRSAAAWPCSIAGPWCRSTGRAVCSSSRQRARWPACSTVSTPCRGRPSPGAWWGRRWMCRGRGRLRSCAGRRCAWSGATGCRSMRARRCTTGTVTPAWPVSRARIWPVNTPVRACWRSSSPASALFSRASPPGATGPRRNSSRASATPCIGRRLTRWPTPPDGRAACHFHEPIDHDPRPADCAAASRPRGFPAGLAAGAGRNLDAAVPAAADVDDGLRQFLAPDHVHDRACADAGQLARLLRHADLRRRAVDHHQPVVDRAAGLPAAGLPGGAVHRLVRPEQGRTDHAAGAVRDSVLDLVSDPRAGLAADARQRGRDQPDPDATRDHRRAAADPAVQPAVGGDRHGPDLRRVHGRPGRLHAVAHRAQPAGSRPGPRGPHLEDFSCHRLAAEHARCRGWRHLRHDHGAGRVRHLLGAIGAQAEHAGQHHRHPGRLAQVGLCGRRRRDPDGDHGIGRGFAAAPGQPARGALSMQGKTSLRLFLALFTAGFIVFLYGPMVVLSILSFQTGPEGGPQFPIIEWSTYWYRHLLGWAAPSRVAPLGLGPGVRGWVVVAVATTVVATVLGVLSAQAFRRRFRASGLVFYLIVLGMIVPGILDGLGVALLANMLGLPRAWWGSSFVVHVVYAYPFAFLVMLAVFTRFDRSLEEAAWSLGVSPATTFRRITFPLIFPGVLSAMLFSFTLSYDEFSRTLFTAGGPQTLPLTIYGSFSVEIHPNLFAFGVLTTLASFTLLAVYGALMALTLRRARSVALQEEIR